MMTTAHRQFKTSDWVLDGAAIIVAWAIALSILWDLLIVGAQKANFYALIIKTFIIPVANVIWLQLRLIPRIIILASKPIRQELAVTQLPANRHLYSQLKKPIIFALAPTWTTWLFVIIAWQVEWRLDITRGFVLIIPALAGLALALGATLELITHLCQNGEGGVHIRYFKIIRWDVAAVGCIVVVPIALIKYLPMLSHYIDEFSATNFSSSPNIFDMFLSLESILSLLIISILVFLCHRFSLKRWRNAVAAYYQFD